MIMALYEKAYLNSSESNGASKKDKLQWVIITFHVRHSRGEMYIDHGHLRVCLSVPRCIPTLLHGSQCNLTEW